MEARVEIVGNRIHLSTEHRLKGLNASIPGANFSASVSRWTFPLSMGVCRDLRRHFDRDLVIGPRLAAWARAEVAHERRQAEIGRSLDGMTLSRLPLVEPKLAALLAARPYQTAGALFMVHGCETLCADTPGLGKTTEAIAAVVESGVPGPYLVVAPKTSLDVVWEREIRARLPRATPLVIAGSKAQREAALRDVLSYDIDPAHPRADSWVIINIEMLRTKSFYVCPECGEEWPKTDHPKSHIVDCGHNPHHTKTRNEHEYPALFLKEWGAIIMDECQKSLLRTSGTPTQQRAGAKLLSSAEGGLRLALSGTPMRGKPQRLWGVLNWLRPKEFSAYWSWIERYWEVKQEGYAGARTIGEFREEKAEDFGRELDRIMIRRTKQEVSPELPAKQYMSNNVPGLPNAIWIPMLPAQQRAYEEMLAQAEAEVENGLLSAVGVLAEITRLKQFANAFGKKVFKTVRVDGIEQRVDAFEPALPSNKWEWLLQFLIERNLVPKEADDEPDGKVIVASQFTSFLRVISGELTKLGVRHSTVTGEVTGGRRTREIDAFNDPASGVNVILLNTTAGGVAVTLDIADDMVIFDETHVPDDQEQLEDRNNNRRPEEKIVPRRYWYLKSLGTIDEGIARKNLEKDAEQRAHLDGRRGVEYLREVVLWGSK